MVILKSKLPLLFSFRERSLRGCLMKMSASAMSVMVRDLRLEVMTLCWKWAHGMTKCDFRTKKLFILMQYAVEVSMTHPVTLPVVMVVDAACLQVARKPSAKEFTWTKGLLRKCRWPRSEVTSDFYRVYKQWMSLMWGIWSNTLSLMIIV